MDELPHIDPLNSWGVASTGFVLVSGASLGFASRIRATDLPAPT